MILNVCGQLMKEMTEEPLYPTANISPIDEIMIVEVMQEISLLKGIDQAFKISCRYLNLKGQFLNVVRLRQISTVALQVCHLRELVVSIKAILINVRVLLCIPQNWDQTRKHTRKKLNSCNECNMTFLQDSELTRHQRIHTGRKAYKCNICCKAFNDKLTLVVHQRNHTGEKPYKCDVCGHCFKQYTHLQQHW